MLDLGAAQERIRQASAGPWKPSPSASDAVIAPNAKRLDGLDNEYYGGPVVGESMHPADREFVIHARTDLPAALDECQRLWKVIKDAFEALDDGLLSKAQAILYESVPPPKEKTDG